ncbi:MAG: AAA family ATPase [bacterium]|nr:AAA family ATPase [bacterium]
MAKSILLIGMSGVGKSTIGKALAKSLNWEFVDGDTLIESKEKKQLQTIINEDGLDAFMKIEENTLNSITLENTVIAPGGSIVYYDNLMRKFQENTIIVYLKNNLNNIKKNIHNLESRGIVGLTTNTLEDIFNERQPLYEKYAHIVIDLSRTPLSKAHQHIEKQLRNYPS